MLTSTGPVGQTHWGDSTANNSASGTQSADAQLKVLSPRIFFYTFLIFLLSYHQLCLYYYIYCYYFYFYKKQEIYIFFSFILVCLRPIILF